MKEWIVPILLLLGVAFLVRLAGRQGSRAPQDMKNPPKRTPQGRFHDAIRRYMKD